MVLMEAKEQPRVASAVSPLLSLHSTFLFCVFCVSLPTYCDIAKVVILQTVLGQEASVESKKEAKGAMREK
jgi:hypothetical protein